MKVDKHLLDKIATEYHMNPSQADMFIENSCQLYELNWVKDKIPLGSHVLDLGYGDGLFLESIASSHLVTLVEGSSELVAAAKSKIKELNVGAQVVNCLFEDYSTEVKFDYVIASHVLEHVDDPRLLLNLIRSWLKPFGKLICIVPNSESLHRRLGMKMGLIKELHELSARDMVVGHQRVYSFEKLEADVTEVGFKIVEARGFFTKSLSNSQMLNLSEEVILGLCKLSDDLPLEMGANIGIVAVLEGGE